MRVSPLNYYRWRVDDGAILANQHNDTGVYTASLAAVRNSKELHQVYTRGATLGADESYANTGPVGESERIYQEIGPLLFENFKRYRLDLLVTPISAKSTATGERKEQGNNKYYADEINSIFEAPMLSWMIKAISIAELALTRTSLRIKNYADTAFEQLAHMTEPGDVFKRLYLGSGEGGDERGIGIYLAFYEALNDQTQKLYQKLWGVDARVYRRTLGDALFLRMPTGGATSNVPLRVDKIAAMELLDQHKMEEAREYLQQLFLLRPEAFNILARKSLFPGGAPQIIDPRTTTEYYANRLFTADVADQYCNLVRHLDADAIQRLGANAVGAVFGMARPKQMQQTWDVLHVISMHGGILGTLAYTSDSSTQTLKERIGKGKSPNLHTALLVAGVDVGFIVRLAENIAEGDIWAHESELTRLLDEARKPPTS